MGADRTDARRRVAEDPVLRDFASPFSDLQGSKRSDLAGGIGRLAKQLAGSKRTGTVQLTLREGRKTRQWCLSLTPKDCMVDEAATDSPDLEILTDAETWTAIASGEVSPLDAFGSGRMRIRGDIELARVIARRARR